MESAHTLARKIIPYFQLKDCHNLNEKEVAENLFINSDVRLKMLVNLMSQFSDAFGDALDKAQDVERELIRQVHTLQFCDTSNKLPFVKATCSEKEQRKVYENIISGLDYVKLTDSEERNERLSDDLTHLTIERREKPNLLKNQNITESWKHIQAATELIQRYQHVLEEKLDPVKSEDTECSCNSVLSKHEIEETCKAINVVSDTVSQLPPLQGSDHLLEPSPAITKLHQLLETNKKVIMKSSNEDLDIKVINPRKFLEELQTFKKTSELINLKLPNRLYS